MSAPRENRLAHETSPYLLQHKHNPVDWFPWGEEALALAKSEDKPVFLSIGYAACHWCHVMERESFEDEEVAAALREGFVAIKVDREERPDLDALYMTATVAMTGGGGWPMSVFMAPDGRPFFAGTYFPKTGKHGRPGFLQLLRRIRELWEKDRDGLLSQADQLVSAVRAEAAGETPRSIGAELEERAVAQLLKGYDAEWGGFGPAPKFPSPLAVSLLLRAHATRGDEAALGAALTTLDRMARGGMRDHVGGGFARYSTDARWHVPHFEKMLYDNAQLARVYVEAFQHTGDRRWAAVARETLDYVVRELTGEHGGYLSATDADSEGVEGKYFVWSKAAIDALLGEDAAAFAAAFDVREAGNWEGHNVLWQPRPLDEVARELGLTREALDACIARSTPKLYAARSERVPPLCDDKVLTSWNGLMIGTMAYAGRVLDEPRYVASATRAAEMLARDLTGEDGRILRAFRAGKAHIDGFLEDYAFLADALIDLYEASGDFAHLERARSLAERAARDFAGGADEGFYTTSTSHEALVVRMRESTDNATPSANAILARAIGRLGAHLGRDDLRARAERAVAAHGRAIARVPRAFLASLDAARWATSPAIEVALVGPDAEARLSLSATVSARWLPQLVLATSDGAAPSPHPLLEGKQAEAGALAFVCRNFTCAAPVSSAEELARALDAARSDAAARPTDRAPGRATVEGTARILAAIDPADTTELAGVRAHRAGVMVSCFHEDEVGALVGKALSEGRNLIATDEERANALGDAVDAAIRRGRSRDEMVLIGLLGDADVARAQSLLAALRLSALDVVLVPVEPADRERAVATARAVREAGLAGEVGLYAASLDDLVALGPLPEPLRVVAAPLNLLEGAPEHAATLAARGLEVVALRPLEIKVDGRVAQLADAALLPPATGVAPLVSALSDLARLEDQYRATIAVHLKVDSEEAVDPAELLSWSRELKRADGVLDDLLEVEAFIAQTLAPALGAAWGALGGLPGEIGERVEALRERYLEALDKALKALGHSVARRQAGFAKTFSDALGGWGVADLPMRATRGVLGVSGVRATLIGTRKADQLFDLGAPRDEDKDVIARVRSARK